MADGNDETSPTTTNWWGSWYSSAKSKSASVFEAVKRDLDEISTVVRTEVSNAGTAIGETLKLDTPDSTANTVKKSLSTFFGQVSEVLVPSIEDDEVEAILITKDGFVTLTGFKKHLADIQINDDTYLKEPDDTLCENYKRWIEVTEQEQFTQQRLAKHLAGSEILNEKYTNLVPEKICHMEFWKRYLFKRALLEDALANAELAERKANKIEQIAVEATEEMTTTKTTTTPTESPTKRNIIQTEQPKKVLADNDLNEDSNGKKNDSGKNWDVNKFDGAVEISEEEQFRLLQEYEIEILEKKKQQSLIIPLEEKLKLDEERKQIKNSSIKIKNQGQQPPPPPPQKQQQQQQQQQQPPPQKQKDTGINKDINEKKKLNNKSNNLNNTTNLNNKNNNSSNNSKAKTTINNKNNTNANAKTDKSPENPKAIENHFPKDDSSSNSDESWEKDFDLAMP